jgi:hypothetical protein
MKELRQRQLLEGQSSVARKVFEGVPIQEAWPENAIFDAVRNNNICIAAHAVRGCLKDMKDVGLVREAPKGHFQRTPVQPPLRLSAAPVQKIKPQPVSEPTVQTPTAKAATVTPLDLLGSVATELTLLASEFGERLRALSLRVEEVALLVEAQREDDAKVIEQANQLKALLKGFGQ